MPASSRCWRDARFAVDAEPTWSPWRGTAVGLLAEANLLVGDVDGARAALEENAAIGPTQDNADNYVMGQGALAQLAMDDGQWDEAAEHVGLALAAVDDHRMDDYPTSIRAYSAAARLAVHRGQIERANRELTRAMRTRPFVTAALPFLAVGARLELARVYLSMADVTGARHLLREVDDLLLERPGLGVLVEQAAALHEALASTADLGVAGRLTAQPRRAPGPALPADPPDVPGDRRAAVRLPQHGQLAGDLDLPQARRLLAHRGRRAGHGHRPHRSLAADGRLLERRFGVVAERHAHLRCGGDDAGHADHGQDTDQDGDDLGGGRPAAHRRIGRLTVGRSGAAAHGDQGGESDERERLGIEVVAAAEGFDLRRPRAVDGEEPQHLGVIQHGCLSHRLTTSCPSAWPAQTVGRRRRSTGSRSAHRHIFSASRSRPASHR